MNERVYAEKAMDIAESIARVMSDLTIFIEKVHENYTDDVHELITAHNRLFGASVLLLSFSRKTLASIGETNFNFDNFLDTLCIRDEA